MLRWAAGEGELRTTCKPMQVDIMVDLPEGEGYATLLRLFIRTVVSW
jgi:hypothetical protein